MSLLNGPGGARTCRIALFVATLLAAHASSAREAAGVSGLEGVDLEAIALVEIEGRGAFCSGALISDRIVLTALHCVQDIGATAPLAASSLRVGFGADIDEAHARRVGVLAVRVRTGVRWSSAVQLRGNDLAVLVLETPVAAIPFAPRGLEEPLEPGAELVILGFGEDRYSLVGRRHATRVRVTRVDDLGFAFVGGGCLGHSGGPVLDRDGRLVGLVSLGTSADCEPARIRFGQPLPPFRDFIAEQAFYSPLQSHRWRYR